MTKLGRTRIVVSLLFGLFMTATSWAQAQRAPILEKIAKTYGVDSFDKIEAIRYTWSGEIPESSNSRAHGSGSPKLLKSPTKGRTKTASPSR